MSFMHHLTTGGEGPTDVFPQTPPAHEVADYAPEFPSGIDEIAEEMSYGEPDDSPETIRAEELQERFADSEPDFDNNFFDVPTPGYCRHGNRVGSAPGGEYICGHCEDGE